MSSEFSDWMCDNAEIICEAWNENLPEEQWVDSVYDIDDDDWLFDQYQMSSGE